MRYTWDEEKAAENKRKHGVTFNAAALALAGPYRVEFYDAAHSYAENR